ncbi:hypothetical protein H4582DRAFT_8074 [Lactarius indigo]|nr:hypothetical protein H4582DRAFT_8074 [Lactarius indigo]
MHDCFRSPATTQSSGAPCSSPFPLPTLQHLCAGLAIQHGRGHNCHGPTYDISCPAEACAPTCAVLHPEVASPRVYLHLRHDITSHGHPDHPGDHHDAGTSEWMLWRNRWKIAFEENDTFRRADQEPELASAPHVQSVPHMLLGSALVACVPKFSPRALSSHYRLQAIICPPIKLVNDSRESKAHSPIELLPIVTPRPSVF